MSRNLPALTVNGDGAVMHSVAKYSRNVVLTVFEMIGGSERMAEWADENPGEFYTKMFAKTIQREVETTNNESVERLLEKLDEQPLDAEFDEVVDEWG